MRQSLFTLCFAPVLATASCTDADVATDPVVIDTAARAKPPLPVASQTDLRTTLAAIVATNTGPGVSITIDHPSYRSFLAAAGIADVATGEAMEPHDRVRAGSMAKTFVATAALQLVERGTLSLDATLTQLLPPSIASRVAEADHITLRMLLSHTGGVPEPIDAAFHQAVFENPGRIWTLDDYLTLSAAQPRPFPPGQGWSYSNMDYILVGAILTQAEGVPWRETVTRHVLRRAGLVHSSFPRPGHAECDGCARGYEPLAGELVDLTEVDPSMADAAGGGALVTTPGDLARFLRALLAGELFDRPGTLALMESFIDAPLPEQGQTQYGLGLAHFQFGPMELVGHYGATAGYNGFMLEDVATGVVFTGSMNADLTLPVLVPPMIQAAGRLP